MNPFIFYLRKEAGLYYKVQGGAVVQTLDATPLERGPEEWEDIQEGFDRNMERHGIFTNYSNAYTFTGKAAKILRKLYYTEGVRAKCQLEIKKLNHTTNEYDPYLVGDLDFDTADDQPFSFGIEIMEMGLSAKIKAYMNTIHEIPILDTDPELIKVKLPSLLAQGEATWVTTFPPTLRSGFPQPNAPTWVPSGGNYSIVSMVNVDTKMIIGPQGQVPIVAHAQNVAEFGEMFTAETTIYEVAFTGLLTFQVNNPTGSPADFKVSFVSGLPGATTGHIIYTGTATASGISTFNVDLSATTAPWTTDRAVMASGSTVQLTAIVVQGGVTTTFDINWQEGRQIQATFKNYTPQPTLKGFRYITVLEKLVDKITDGHYGASSSLLSNALLSYTDGIDNRPWDSIVFPGDSVRGITNPVMKISLADLYKDADVRWSVGLDTTSGTVSIEKKGDYYDMSGSPVELGEASRIAVSTASDLIYGDIKIGYEEQTYDEVNGRDEFNTTQVYKMPDAQQGRTLDLVSPWRSDMWGMFFTYTKYVLSASKDSDSDNSIFVVEIGTTLDSGGYYAPLHITPITPTVGISDPANSFNYGFSPKHCFFRAGSFIRIGLFGQDNETITYQTTDKNGELQVNLASGIITENANVSVFALADALALPFYFEVDIATPEDLATMIRNQPYKRFRTTYKGVPYVGFLMNGSVKGAHRDEFTFKLLASTDNNTSNFIR